LLRGASFYTPFVIDDYIHAAQQELGRHRVQGSAVDLPEVVGLLYQLFRAAHGPFVSIDELVNIKGTTRPLLIDLRSHFKSFMLFCFI
jgi:hypothetical protein